jgi:hypothetical protein
MEDGKKNNKHFNIIYILFLLLLFGCNSNKPITGDDVIASFKASNLEAENSFKMGPDDYGFAPFVCEGTRFFIPSLGENNGGRVFICENQEELKSLEEYYQELGKTSAMFYSWTFHKDNILVQINGSLDEDIAMKYKDAIP